MRVFVLLFALLAGLASVPLAPVVAAPAADSTAKIRDFAGSWVGRTEPGSDRERAATLTIESRTANTFKVEWASFETQRTASGDVTKRASQLVFRQSKEPGVWLGEVKKDPFDILAAWATIEDRSLVVSTIALRADGRLERQTYRRTLTADGLALSYRRWLDQDLDREIQAEFLRVKSLPVEKKKRR